MNRVIGAVTLLLLSLAGCSSSVSAPPPTAPAPAAANDLKAVVTQGARADTVIVEYRNRAAKEVVVSKQVLVTGNLALEVTERGGRVMSPVPPPTPWPHDPGVRIPAGGTHREEYSLNMFSPALPPGQYRVRTRVEGWACEPLDFEVRAEPQ